MGRIFGNNLWLNKRAIEMKRLGTSRLTCFSPRGHPSTTIFWRQHSLRSRKRAYRRPSRWSKGICRHLYRQHNGPHGWFAWNEECWSVGSSHSPLNWGPSPSKRCEQTNPTWENGTSVKVHFHINWHWHIELGFYLIPRQIWTYAVHPH